MILISQIPEPTKPPIRVLIVDDMPQVREDLRVLLQLSEEIEIIGEAVNGEEAVRQAEQFHPDVVVMDLEMPIMDGIRATTLIKQHMSAKRVVVLSVHSDAGDIIKAMEAGADAFIQKGSPYATLIEAINPKNNQTGENQ